MEGYREKAGRDILSEKMIQKNEGEKEGSGDETTLVEVHTTQFSLHMQAGISHGSLKDSSFLFLVLNGGKSQCITTRTLTTQSLYCPNSELRHPHFLNHLNWENFSFHDQRQCIESVDLFLTHTSSSFNQSISIPEHCMGASTSLSEKQILSSGIFGLVLRPSLVGF